MNDATPTRALGESPHDPAARLTQNEALLAVLVEHLADEVSSLRYVLGGVLNDLYGRDRCHGEDLTDWPAYAKQSLYRDQTSDGHPRAAPMPFPPYWLGDMARSGRTVAQVAGSRAAAAGQLEAAFSR